MPANPAKLAAPAAARPPAVVNLLFPAYLAAIFLGYVVLRIPGAMLPGAQMGKVRALFSAVNAATLTGFRQPSSIDTYEPLGQIVMLALMLIGSVLTLIISGAAISRILKLGYSDRAIIKASLIAHALAIVIGGFFLLFDSDRTVFQALFLAVSSFANCGLILGPAPAASSWLTPAILFPLFTAGGLGICVIIELWRLTTRKSSAPMSAQTRAALLGAAWLFVGGTLLIAALSLLHSQPPRTAFTDGATAAVASRTAGMGLVDVAHMARPALWIVVLLMSVGAASGGTAGGIKTTTLIELYRGVARALAGKPAGRAFGNAAVWTGIYLLLVFLTVLLLLALLPQDSADRVIVLAVSAASNVGLSHDTLNPDAGPAFVLCVTMLIGRFGPMMILWWMADTTADAELAVG